MRTISALLVITACGTEPNVCQQVEQHFAACELAVPIDCSGTSEEDFERVLALSCQELEQLMGSTPESAGKADFVIERAPANWTGYHFTNAQQVDWLYTWTTLTGFLLLDNYAEGVVNVFSGVLSQAELDAIAADLRELGNVNCQYLVAYGGEQIRSAQQRHGNYVCRHHAVDLKRLLSRFEISGNIEGATRLDGWLPIGHAWTEVDCGNQKIVADAYNRIYVAVQ